MGQDAPAETLSELGHYGGQRNGLAYEYCDGQGPWSRLL
jgi:hypothetical protein